MEGEDYELAVAVDAAQTSPFLTNRRVVVVRNLARFSADELAPLVAYLGDPLPTTDLILVWEKAAVTTARLNPIPKKLSEALAGAGGEVVDTSVGRNAKEWVNDQLAASTVNLDKGARDLVASHLAGDLGRLAAVITTVEAAYGPGAKLDSDAVAPFLGEAGGVPPWDLTDAIDSGDIGLAIERVHRMLGTGTMHSLQVLAILTTHFRRILALEGADVRNEADASPPGAQGEVHLSRQEGARPGQPPRLRRQRPHGRTPRPGRRRPPRQDRLARGAGPGSAGSPAGEAQSLRYGAG